MLPSFYYSRHIPTLDGFWHENRTSYVATSFLKKKNICYSYYDIFKQIYLASYS